MTKNFYHLSIHSFSHRVFEYEYVEKVNKNIYRNQI